MSGPRDVKLLTVRQLRRNKRNPRTHSERQVRQIAKNIERFGWTQPILIDESGLILAGHARYEAALLLGLRRVPVIVVSGFSDAEKRALALADNKIAANAGWDCKLLAEELGELTKLLPEVGLDLEITGFAAPELDSLLGDFAASALDPAHEMPSPKRKATSKPGDLWQLGPHQLLCGNARRLADVDAAVRHWQAYTRREAILQSTGQTFKEVAAVRSKTGGTR